MCDECATLVSHSFMKWCRLNLEVLLQLESVLSSTKDRWRDQPFYQTTWSFLADTYVVLNYFYGDPFFIPFVMWLCMYVFSVLSCTKTNRSGPPSGHSLIGDARSYQCHLYLPVYATFITRRTPFPAKLTFIAGFRLSVCTLACLFLAILKPFCMIAFSDSEPFFVWLFLCECLLYHSF